MEGSINVDPGTEPLISNSEDEEQGLTGCGATPCCNPNHALHRFLALMLMCLIGFGSCFCYDNPGALQDNFMTDLGMSTSQFVYLYSWYSWPNVVLCMVGGFLMDRIFGIRLGSVIFATLVVMGQLVFALGGLLNLFWLMVVGRFIFGIGGESLAVAQNSYAVLWFKGKELNMVFGLQLSFARVGSTVNFQLMEPLYKFVNKYYSDEKTSGVVLFIASATCTMSLVCGIVLAWMDRRAERILRRKPSHEGEVVRITDVKDFPALFWMICALCVTYYMAIFPFIALGKVFFERKFDFSPDSANSVNSIVYLISAVASPILGLMIDRVGKNVLCAMLAVLVSIGCHVLLAFTFLNPYVAMSILGVAYSMAASGIWPMISLIIPEYQLGTAYGIAQALQNLGLAVITLIAGYIVDTSGYLFLELFFLGWLCLSLIIVIVIWILDANSTGILNMSASERDEFEKNQLAVVDLEREKLLASGSMCDVSPQDLLQPHSDFHIRNRYLSRIGAPLPSHCTAVPKSAPFRPLR
ncbi:major facilitator superfamily domain-containing protein 1-like [Bacillus rossius redtenbacheri]|uniref:major facilitator superfamily domain-containing protein 1-like n=1 Tax=Bacillus rossius redtenbacheri TaxID=93214 RepID=UPI002FDD1447